MEMKSKGWQDSIRTLWHEHSLLLLIIAIKLAIHFSLNPQYGFFRDELYYIAASKRLAFGYVDFPPLIAVLTAAVRMTLGESLFALRLLPALAGAAVIFLAGRIASVFGGGKYAQALAGLCVLTAPVFLGTNSLMTMDSFEQLFWALALYILARIFASRHPRGWLAFGLVAGLSLTAKVTMLYFGFALVIGLLLTAHRKAFRHWQLYAAGLFALLFLLPYAVWNLQNGFPTLLFWANYHEKVSSGSLIDFLLQQILVTNPFSVPVWISGLFFLFSRRGSAWKPLGWMYLLLLVMFIVQGAKFYFLAPFYPVLFAAGSVVTVNILGKPILRWARIALPAAMFLLALVAAPLSLPTPPIEFQARYLAVMQSASVRAEANDSGVLPQNIADRFGWPELAETVQRAYQTLTAEEQAKACIFAGNYGQAGALEFYGPDLDLPPVISPHNNYYFWSPGTCTGEIIVYLGYETPEVLAQVFESVSLLGFTSCEYCMWYENEHPIYLCRGLRAPIEDVWREAAFFQ